MSEIGKVFCTDILNALRKEQLLILSGEKALDIFSQWTLHYGLDSHEFVVTELIRMDEGDNKDTVKFTQNRHKGKLKRYQYREGSGCKEASTHHRAEGEGKVAHPSDTLVLRLVSLLNSPEEYLCMVRGRLLFPPYAVPMDTKDGDEMCHDFKHLLFRLADCEGENESPLVHILNDIFREVVLPNLINMGRWNDPGRRDIDNSFADVMISLLVRNILMIMDAQSVYDSSGHPRRYSFQEHTALYEAAQTDPAMSPEEYSELEGHQIASGSSSTVTERSNTLGERRERAKRLRLEARSVLEIADNLELEADKLQEEADAKRQKAADLRSELEMLGKPAGNGDK